MNTLRLLRRFWQRPFNDRVLLVEAVVALAVARMTIRTRRAERYLAPASVPARRVAAANPSAVIARIRWAIEQSSPQVPWNALCLPQALAARGMLARRGIASHVNIGAAKGGGGTLTAHAWLVAAGEVVTGDDRLERYTVLRTFAPGVPPAGDPSRD